jgi:hypothetical protein
MFEQFVIDAIEMVSASDLSDEVFVQAVNDHARLMAGIGPDDLWEVNAEQH